MTRAFNGRQMQFFANASRPSAVLSTDMALDKDQAQAIRDRWNEQAKSLHAGEVPILTGGLKVQPWTTAHRDAQTAELMRMSAEQIAHAFRVPLPLLAMGGGAPLGSTEAVIRLWHKTSLNFTLTIVEQAYDSLFGLRGEPVEYCELDVGALLRSEEKDRIEMVVRGVQGGVSSPNEARNMEGLDSVPYGDEPRVQQQVVPLSAAGSIPPAPPAPGPAASPSAPAEVKDYQTRVRLDIDALTARARRPERLRLE